MNIIGIGGSNHDYSCCLLKNGRIICAIEEERVSREKHAIGMKSQLLTGVDYCLDMCGLTEDDIDIVASNTLLNNSYISKKFKGQIVKISHHMAHASSSYYNSGMLNSVVLVVDGCGDNNGSDLYDTISCGYAENGKIKFEEIIRGEKKYYKDYLLSRQEFFKSIGKNSKEELAIPFVDNSLGDLYAIITYFCSFGACNEGKVMGLAPYGSSTYVKKMKQFVNIQTESKIQLKISNKELIDWLIDESKNLSSENEEQWREDIAFAVQEVLENVIFQIMNYLYQKYQCENLCYSGGVALNSVLNGKIKEKTPFKNVFVFPAAGDSGTAFGAAQYCYHLFANQKYMGNVLQTPYYGKSYTRDEIKEAIGLSQGIIATYFDSDERLFSKLADELADNKIIGWFNGKCEFGPRALGNRSILASPIDPKMKDILNSKVKFREAFRPFAPVVMKEFVSDFFDTDFPHNPYMLYVGNVKKNKYKYLGAVTHVDGSARLQTISYEQNKRYYKVIEEFYKKVGVPVLVNTSFNIKSQPIVETPKEAIECLLNSDLDYVVIDNYLIERSMKSD